MEYRMLHRMNSDLPYSAGHRGRRARSRAAFTLLEMIFVLAIISALVGMGIYAVRGIGEDADIVRVRADLKTLQMNLVRYRTQSMSLPTEAQGLQALVTRPTLAPQPKNWSQKMTADGLLDPWGNPYQYRNPGKRSQEAYDLFSMGVDGRAESEDDIGNW
jgi:general secretion pathway protein G